MKTSLKRFFAGVAAAAMAVGGLALGATSAQAVGYDTNTIVTKPEDDGTITINAAKDDTQDPKTRSFKGYKLASLKHVKTDSTGRALESFIVDTNSKYTSVIQTVMDNIKTTKTDGTPSTLLQDYEADKAYYKDDVTKNNPLGYIAATYGKVVDKTKDETNYPWGGDKGNGTGDSVMRQFADKLSAELAKDTNTTTYPADKDDLKIGINTVPQGLYLITETTNLANATKKDTAGAAVNSAPMIVSTTYTLTDFDGNTTTVDSGVGIIDLKATSPTITKQVMNGNGNDEASMKANPDFSIGDPVDYELTATIPSYTGYAIDTTGKDSGNARVLKIYDEAEPGLTITDGSVKSVTVTPDGSSAPAPLVKDTDYTVETSTDSDATDSYKDGTKTVINLANYVNMRAGTVSAKNGTVASGGKITVEITATLNSKAKVSDATHDPTPNMNKVTLGYSHIPDNVTDEHKQPGGEVNVYTYKFNLFKQDHNKTPLAGAQFVIMNKADKKYLQWTAATDPNGKTGAWSTVAKKPTAAAQVSAAPTGQEKTEANAKGIFYSDADGMVVLNGLKAGTYTVEEIASPKEYLNALLPTFDVTINPTYTPDTTTKPKTLGDGTSWGDYTANEVAISNTGDNNNLVPVENTGTVDVTNVKSITELPKTGAAGIAFFSIIGVAIVAMAALFAVRARKAAKMA